MSDTTDSHMLAEVAVLKTKVEYLTVMMEKQDKVLEAQNKVLQELTALANQGKGSLWMFITLGGLIGAILSNLKSFIGFFVH